MIEFLNLKKVNKPYFKQFEKKAKKIINKGYYILHEEVELFEKKFAKFQDSKFCVGVGSGFDAIYLTLKAYLYLGKLNYNDQILVASNSYIATILAIHQANLKPIIVDIDKTFNINHKKIENKITKKTKAILATSLYGQTPNLKKLKKIAKKYNLLLLEDAAQAHGSKHYKKLSSTYTNCSMYSFYPTKNLGSLGDGGAIITDDQELYHVVKNLRNYGCEDKFNLKYKGNNSRLDEIQAGFLNIKLDYLNKINQKRKKIANFYLKNIKNKNIILPTVKKFNDPVWHLFVIRTKQREKLRKYLLENQIQTAIHYPILFFDQIALKDEYKNQDIQAKKAKKYLNQILSIPLNEALNKKEIRYIVDVLNKFE